MRQLTDIRSISNEEFEKMAVAVADSTTVMIQGQKFDGRKPHSYNDIQYYYSKIDSPNTHSRSFLIATQTSVDKEYFPPIKNFSDAPIMDRARLKQIYGHFRETLEVCLNEGKMIDVEVYQKPDGVHSTIRCHGLPSSPQPPQPSSPARSSPRLTI